MRTILLLSALVLPAFTQEAAVPHTSTQTQSTSTAKKLTRSEVDDLLSRPGQVLFIDVRRPDEISTIGGFPVYLSIQLNDLPNELASIPRDKQIVTISNHAARASKAADLLASKGFTVVGAVGAQSYESEGGHLVKIVPQAAVAHK